MIKPDNGNPVFADLPPGFTEDCLSTAKYSCVLSQGLSVADISPAMAEELGLDPEFAIGCSFYDIMGDANKESVAKLKEIADLKKGRIVVDLHYGEDKKIQVEARVLNHGAMSWILLFVNNDSDVENQRKTEPAQDGIIYTKHFEDAADGMTLSTPEGEILAVNRVFLKMLKYPESPEIKLHAVKDNLYVNLQDRERLLNLVKEKGVLSGYEMDMRASDGSVVSIICSVSMFRDRGKTYYESVFKDITAHRNLEKELIKQKEALEDKVRKRTAVLERQRDKLMAMNRQCKAASAELRSILSRTRALFNAITDPVIAMDRDFNVLVMNRPDEVAGKKCYEVLFDRNEACEKCPAVKAIRLKKPASVEIQRGDRYYQLQCYPVFDPSGKVEGVIEYAQDITKDKDFSNQMLQADRLASLGQLVSGIGHEINNPNTFILGNMKIIKEALDDILPILDEHYKKHPDLKIARLKYPFFKDHIKLLADDMESGAERIQTIVHDLRKFARKSEDRFEEAAVNGLVERSIRLIANQVKRKANIKTELAANLPAVRANGIGLEQVFVNIIMNASEAFGEEAKGDIYISTGLNHEEDCISISFKDNGSGMDTETMRHIFDPFFTTKRNRGGTGLGLSIAYRIIKEHDGEIEVESTPGKGTTFTISIPAVKEAKGKEGD